MDIGYIFMVVNGPNGRIKIERSIIGPPVVIDNLSLWSSVTRKKSPNVGKSCLKMISLEK